MGTRREEPAAAGEDWRLLAEAGRGRPEAFAPLVERHQGRILRLCERFLGDPEEARDAAQEVFLKAFRHAAGAEPRGLLSTWLYRIAVNHCLNRLRRRNVLRFVPFSRTSPAPDGEGVEPDPRDPGPDPEAAASARERWRRTRRAIERLPPSQRAVLLLAKFEGLSYREIAAVLGVTEGAVESRLVRAMRRLQAAQEGGSMRVSREGERR